MKRCFLAILLLSGIVAAYAQQSSNGASLPTSAQTKQSAQQYVSQAKSNSSQFESTLEALRASNASNKDTATYNRLKSEIDNLEASINAEQAKIKTALDSSSKLSSESFKRVDQLIEKHKAKTAELEAFVAQ
jgi:uncharacterized protein (UPF0333 family)